jgi:alanine racemase
MATIPVGYADGYPRQLSNKGWVLIHGKKAPICGRVCMDQFMVDVTKIADVKAGDEVTLLGRDGQEVIDVDTLGDLSGRFSYEFVCDISKRVPRIYIKDKKECGDLNFFD